MLLDLQAIEAGRDERMRVVRSSKVDHMVPGRLGPYFGILINRLYHSSGPFEEGKHPTYGP